MSKSPKVEAYCLDKKVKLLTMIVEEKVCTNCIWYEQYYRKNWRDIRSYTPTCTGYCILNDKTKGPLQRACKEFEKE